MKKSDLTAKQVNSLPCPTCGVPPGQKCILAWGGLRHQPHTNRKLAAVDAFQERTKPLRPAPTQEQADA